MKWCMRLFLSVSYAYVCVSCVYALSSAYDMCGRVPDCMLCLCRACVSFVCSCDREESSVGVSLVCNMLICMHVVVSVCG